MGAIDGNVYTGCGYDGDCDRCGHPDCYATRDECTKYMTRDLGRSADYPGARYDQRIEESWRVEDDVLERR